MKRIILGTAHTAQTPGKCSPDKKLREYDYSRKVTNGVKQGLEAHGVVVYGIVRMYQSMSTQPGQMASGTMRQVSAFSPQKGKITQTSSLLAFTKSHKRN